jgi:anti-sigma factor RsiW
LGTFRPCLTCRELVELVTDHLEARLEPGLGAAFERHMEGCRGCAAYLEQMRQVIAALRRLREDDLDPAGQAELVRLFRGWRRPMGTGA